MQQEQQRHFIFFLIDMLMLVILMANLLWIVFDALFGIPPLQAGLEAAWKGFVEFYLPVHRNFFYYDLGFISIYIAELLIQWSLAVKRRTYHRWFFYPFIHWYDVIGCIPIGTLRFVRIIRIISILYRLQKLEWIDFRGTFLYRLAAKYYAIFTEEISDRVVVNVLEGMQSEIRQGSPVIDRIVHQVIKSRKPEMIEWFSQKMQHVARENYGDFREDIRRYVDLRVREAVKHNRELTLIRRSVPVVGGMVTKNMENVVSDIVFQVINGMAEDLSEKTLDDLFDQLADIILGSLLVKGEDQRLNAAVIDTMIQAIEIIKDQVRVQQWKLREEAFGQAGASAEAPASDQD